MKWLITMMLLGVVAGLPAEDAMGEPGIRVERLEVNPILTPASSTTLGDNINGPSVIRVPDWVAEPLGRYYLYFAHHKGKFIRLAYADDMAGPWTVHEPGTLTLEQSLFPSGTLGLDDIPAENRKAILEWRGKGLDLLYTHIASPDVVVDETRQEIRMYYHGMMATGAQATRVAVSKNGLDFVPLPDIISRPYLRVFQWQGLTLGMAMPGVFYRSADGLTGFEQGPTLFNPDMRHAALLLRDKTLYVFWTQVGDAPERILLSTIDLRPDWREWQASAPIEVLRPETDWEGASLPLEPSRRGAIEEPANQLRDPAVFEDDSGLYLLYSIAGEAGIAIARMTLER